MKHSKTLLVALAFCIGALVGALFVQAQTSLSIQYLMGGLYPGAPSYFVWREGTSYLGKDANGQIDYSGTNASEIISSALNAISSVGGAVHLSADTFLLDSPIVIPKQSAITQDSALALIGESYGKKGQRGTIIKADASLTSLLINDYDNDECEVLRVDIRDIAFEGANQTADLIQLWNVDSIKIQDCNFRYWTDYAITSKWAGTGSAPQEGPDVPGKVEIYRCNIDNQGAICNGSLYYEYNTENYIVDNIFTNGDQETVIHIKDSYKFEIRGNQINQINNATKTPKALIYLENTGTMGYTPMYCREIHSWCNWLYLTGSDGSPKFYAHQIYDSNGTVTYYPTRVTINDIVGPFFHGIYSGKIAQSSQVRYNGWFGFWDALTTNASGMIDITFEATCGKTPLITVTLSDNFTWYVKAWDQDVNNWYEGCTIQIVNTSDGSAVGAAEPAFIHTQYYN